MCVPVPGHLLGFLRPAGPSQQSRHAPKRARVTALKADRLTTKYGHGHVAHAAVPAVHHATAAVVAPAHHAAVGPAYHAYSSPLHIPHLVTHYNGAVAPAGKPVVANRVDHLAADGAVHHATGYAAAAIHHHGAAGVSYGIHLAGRPNGAVTAIDEPTVETARADQLANKYGVYGAE